jgi:2-hydroxychromene-2-carboxylate isomerase
LHAPRSHPFNPLLALRVTSVEMDASVRSRLIDLLFAAAWSEGRDLADPTEVATIASHAGLDGERIVELATTPEVKRRLIDTTRRAIDVGVFGVPTTAVGSDLFWGFDDFPHLELFLDGEDPLDPAGVAAWAQVKPSADRRGKA